MTYNLTQIHSRRIVDEGLGIVNERRETEPDVKNGLLPVCWLPSLVDRG